MKSRMGFLSCGRSLRDKEKAKVLYMSPMLFYMLSTPSSESSILTRSKASFKIALLSISIKTRSSTGTAHKITLFTSYSLASLPWSSPTLIQRELLPPKMVLSTLRLSQPRKWPSAVSILDGLWGRRSSSTRIFKSDKRFASRQSTRAYLGSSRANLPLSRRACWTRGIRKTISWLSQSSKETTW